MSRPPIAKLGSGKITKYTNHQYIGASVLTVLGSDFDAANLVKTAFVLPTDAIVTGGFIIVDEVFAAGTLSLGDSTTANRYADAVDLTALAKTDLTVTGLTVEALNEILATVSGASATGKARIYIEYIGEEKADWTME